MANIIHVQVENPDELRNASAYGTAAIIRLQSAALEAGPFSNETTEPLVAATRQYTLYDADGTTSTWYRTRYENGAGTITSDWSEPFQAGDESGGLICSVYDVEQRVGSLSANDEETVTDIIRGVTTAIQGYCGRWFVPHPLSGDATLDFDVARNGYELRIPKGIRSITTLEVATLTGGSYTTVTSYYLRPTEVERDFGWPATRVVLPPASMFYAGLATVRITGAFGWAAVPADIQEIGVEATIRKWIGKETTAPAIAVGPAGTIAMLRGLSPEHAEKLNWYRDWPA